MSDAARSGEKGSCDAGNLAVLFTQDEIEKRVSELARLIDASYGCEPLVAVCVLKGAFMFFSDLTRRLSNPNLELDFVRLSSYGKSQNSSGRVIFNKDTEVDIKGKHALIVEDIVDSGRSMRFLCDQFKARKPLSVAIASLVDKRERRESDVKVDFSGFTVDKGFLVGYGMDYAEKYRALPDICELKN